MSARITTPTFLLVFVIITLILLVGCSLDNALMGSEDRSTSPQENYLTMDGSGSETSTDGGKDYYPGTEKFGELSYNGFVFTAEDNLSTFGVDVDNGSYTFGRKKLNEGLLPPTASVRVEEYINYFRQNYPAPSEKPFSVAADGAPSPFRSDSLHILRIGIRGRDAAEGSGKIWNLTFLVDISGSMTSRLELVKKSLYVLVDNMRPGDRISVCTYAGGVKTIMTPTSIGEKDKETIKGILSELKAGGSTAMASGIQNAYNVNLSGFADGGVNRVIVCSDGDANVGPTSHNDILALIDSYVDKGITLSTLGFGMGNYNDHLMEQLANKGNGNYYYIDSEAEAKRLFTEEIAAVMEVIAKDVKVQVEFNRSAVVRYRLIGYENRDIADTDFTKDTTDAGEIGAGHCVTALYEIELADNDAEVLGIVHLRYKLPGGTEDIAVDVSMPNTILAAGLDAGDRRLRFSAGIAEFAEILRESPYASNSLANVESLVSQTHNSSDDRDVELLQMVKSARRISGE
jgi:Ca-activated chloride channel family protein